MTKIFQQFAGGVLICSETGAHKDPEATAPKPIESKPQDKSDDGSEKNPQPETNSDQTESGKTSTKATKTE